MKNLKISNVPFRIEGDNTRLDYFLTGRTDLVTDEMIEKLKEEQIGIYFNDTTSTHWIFDFEINGIWFEGIEVLPNNESQITFNVFK